MGDIIKNHLRKLLPNKKIQPKMKNKVILGQKNHFLSLNIDKVWTKIEKILWVNFTKSDLNLETKKLKSSEIKIKKQNKLWIKSVSSKKKLY